MRLVIDDERCAGHGRCYSLLPEFFESDDQGNGVVLREAVDAGLAEQARMAVLNCPEQAIALLDS